MSNRLVRTRIAPSPTGEDIHIGNLYTALINFVVARKNHGKFIIRIEDTDRTRYISGSEEKILSSLKAYGIKYDEGPDIGGQFSPYRQSDRLKIYQQYAQELIEKRAAYYCFCTKERLEEIRKQQISTKKIPRYDKYCLAHGKNTEEKIKKGEPYVIRLNVQHGKKISFQDVIRGKIEFESDQIDDQILIKSDGYPTYHMGVVVDDHLMEISHVIRAEEWISSTPKHILLYESFGWDLPIFAHLPILRNPDHSKLSKRKNPVWASWYLQEGYLPEAILNFLALLGWSHPDQKEIFSLDELIQLFDLKDVNPIGPVFDLTKLQWMNGEYIRRCKVEDLRDKILKFDSRLNLIDGKMIQSFVMIAQTRMKTLKEFSDLVNPFLHPTTKKLSSDEEKLKQELKQGLEFLKGWEKDSIASFLMNFLKENNIKFPVLYKIFIGKEKGLPLADIFEILGKDKTLQLLS